MSSSTTSEISEKEINANTDTTATAAAPAKKPRESRARRAKYVTLYSNFLMKETKHELIGEPVITESGRQQWARCTRSHHSQLINLDAIEAEKDKSRAVIHCSKDDAKKYSPTEEYTIGDVIFHTIWDDIGIVQRKDTTSTGGNAIVVQFEKNLEKKLIENYRVSN
jgi:hypothetical protein